MLVAIGLLPRCRVPLRSEQVFLYLAGGGSGKRFHHPKKLRDFVTGQARVAVSLNRGRIESEPRLHDYERRTRVRDSARTVIPRNSLVARAWAMDGRNTATLRNCAGCEMSPLGAYASQSTRFALYGHETGPVLRRR